MEIVTKQGHPDFLDLPWDVPLVEWHHPRLVKMAHGISRHVVRFVRFDERVYALKATSVDAAQTEYRVLRSLRDDHLPVVEPVGVVSDAPQADDAVLITRYLDYSLPYWYLLGRGDPTLADRLMDAGVVLLVRLHLEGVFWGPTIRQPAQTAPLQPTAAARVLSVRADFYLKKRLAVTPTPRP